jgi:hypothetical protein
MADVVVTVPEGSPFSISPSIDALDIGASYVTPTVPAVTSTYTTTVSSIFATVAPPDPPAPISPDVYAAQEILGTDIWLGNVSSNPDTVLTSSGDLHIISGRECLRQAIIRRLITRPGEWATNPTYGVGATDYIRERNTQEKRDELKSKIRGQLILDPRISRVDGIEIEENNGLLRIAVRVTSKQLGEDSPIFALIELN